MGIERRPIAARKLPVFIHLSRVLVRAGVTPNAISVVGLVACIAAGLCFWLTGRSEAAGFERGMFVLGAALVQLRLLCNMLDGMVAIEGGKTSPVGELYNEIPDRISDMATLIGFGYAMHARPELGYLAGTLAVLTAYVRAAGKVAGAPQDYRGPMAKQQRMFLITLASLYMALAPDGLRPTPAAHGWSVPNAALVIIAVGSALTCVRRTLGAARFLNASPRP